MKRRQATIKDVARQAKVSTATVSRVLNRDEKVSLSTRESVLQAMDELGYRVNPIARSLRSSITHTIGIISPEFRNDFFMAVAEGIEDLLRREGYTTFILNSRESLDEELSRIELLIEKQVDGAILIPAGSRGEHYHRLSEEDIPFVLVDRVIAGMDTDAVLTDNVQGAYEAVKLAAEDGAERIALLGGDPSISSARERHQGYMKALTEQGIPADESIITYGDMHFGSGYSLMGKILEADPGIRHVFVVNLFMRLGAEKYLAEEGNSDIRFIAFDESPLCTFSLHNYITVSQPMESIGSAAAEILLKRIRKTDDSPPGIHRLPPDIIVHREESS